MARCELACLVLLAAAAGAVKVKVLVHSDQDSAAEEEPPAPALPFLRRATAAPAPTPAPAPHPADLLFPLIYRQSHVNSMFKFGENWYTWSSEQRADGSRALDYYVCYDEPKRCDDVGWERTDAVPRCAFEIDSVVADDRACLNAFGVAPRPAAPAPTARDDADGGNAVCDGADQMKVSEVVRACGPRLRSLWRFARVSRRPPAAAKPADVNSLLCEDEDECFLTLEYRIHRDRITFSLHEPTRGQTYKSVLRREQPAPAPAPAPADASEARARRGGRGGGAGAWRERVRAREPRKLQPGAEPAEGKGAPEEPNSGYHARRTIINKIKIHDDVSDDFSSDN